MKRMIIVLISLILGNFYSIATADENIINYNGDSISISTAAIANVEFRKSGNFTLIENHYGIFAYLDFKGKFIGRNPDGKLLNKYRLVVEDDFVKKITISEFNPDTIRISIKLQKKENLFCAHDPKSGKIYITKEMTISKNIVTEKKKEKKDTTMQKVEEEEKEEEKEEAGLQQVEEEVELQQVEEQEVELQQVEEQEEEVELQQVEKQEEEVELQQVEEEVELQQLEEEIIEKEFSVLEKVEWDNNLNSLNLSFDSILSGYEIINDGFEHLVVFDLMSGVDYKVSRTLDDFQNPYLNKIRIQQFNSKTLRVVFHVSDPDILFDIKHEKNRIALSFDNFRKLVEATGKNLENPKLSTKDENQEKEKLETEKKVESGRNPLLQKPENKITVKDIIEFLPNKTASDATDKSVDGKEKTDAADEGIKDEYVKMHEIGAMDESVDGKEKTDAQKMSVKNVVNTAEEENSSFSLEDGSIEFDSDIEELFTDIDIEKTEKQEKKKISFGGQAEVYAAKDFQEEDYEDAGAFNSSLILKIDYYPKNENISTKASIRILQDKNSPDNKLEANIWETSLDYDKKIANRNLKLSLGKRIVRFGKTDEISPLDNINPEDLRFFVTRNYDERKLPIWLASAETKIFGWQSEFVYIPFFQEAKIHQFGNDWSVFGNFKDELKDQGLPFYNALIKNISVTEIMPEKSLANGEFATRFRKTFGSLDTEFVYSYTYNDMPFYTQIPEILKGKAPNNLQNFILDYRNRSHLLGFAIEGSLKDIGLRAEAAWSSERPFLRENFEAYTGDVFHLVIGADYSYLDWYFNFQYSHEINLQHMENTLYSEKHNPMLLGQIAYGNIFDNTLGKKYKIGADFSAGLNNYSVYAKPYAKYYFDGGLSLEAFANLFYGDRGTMMGDKKNSSEYGMKLAYSF